MKESRVDCRVNDKRGHSVRWTWHQHNDRYRIHCTDLKASRQFVVILEVGTSCWYVDAMIDMWPQRSLFLLFE